MCFSFIISIPVEKKKKNLKENLLFFWAELSNQPITPEKGIL